MLSRFFVASAVTKLLIYVKMIKEYEIKIGNKTTEVCQAVDDYIVLFF